MDVWVFRRGEWEARPARSGLPAGQPQTRLQRLTQDGSVQLSVGSAQAEFPYTVSLQLGDAEFGRVEWICLPDLPSLLQLMQLLVPWLRSEVAMHSVLNSMLDDRLGPPPDQPVGTGAARDLTVMNSVLFDDTAISVSLELVLHAVNENSRDAGTVIEKAAQELTALRAKITTEGDPNATRLDAVITLLQSASLLLQSEEYESALAETKKAIAAWKMDENERLLP